MEAVQTMAGLRDGVPFAESAPSRSTTAAANAIVAEEMGFSWGKDARTRRVLLRDGWWHRDHGPLVGELASDRCAVALLRRRGRYVLHDPASGDEVEVDAEVAGRLASHAHALYRPLPARVLTIADLLRWGASGTAGDCARLAVVTVAWALTGLVPAVVAGTIFDSVVFERDVALLVQLALLLVAVAFAAAMLDVARKMAWLRLETRIANAVQPAIWDRLLTLPVRFFRRFSAGELATRANAIDEVRRTLTGVAASAIVGGVFALTTLALLFWYSAALAAWAVLLGAIAALVTLLAGAFRMRYEARAVQLESRLAGLVLQLLSGIAKIRVCGAERRAFAVWAAAFAEQKHFAMRAERVEARLKAFQAMSTIAATVVMFALFLDRVGDGGLSTGDFVAFQAAFAAFLTTVTHMGFSLVQAMPVVQLLRSAKPILEATPESSSRRSSSVELAGAIAVRHVSFRYDPGSRLVLDDVSLHARAGELIALVGPSGGGKSTLLRLLLGFESPLSGTIDYDGRSLANLDAPQLRRSMGTVLQNSRVMAGDIFSNIAGAAPLTLEEAWDAAGLAGLADDIRTMPMGMHTVLPEGATTLSGGQRQRLLIARALARRPKLLLFDEATSALDNRTQKVVDESLSRLSITRIVIAHRLTTVRNAHRIYMLAGGRVVESGPYAELLGNDGPFARMAARQSET